MTVRDANTEIIQWVPTELLNQRIQESSSTVYTDKLTHDGCVMYIPGAILAQK